MKYYDLSEGKYINGNLTDDELWSAFSWLFHKSAANDTSYKFLFFNSLMDCMKYGSKRVHFDEVYERFCFYSWPLIVKYGIRQKAKVSDGRRTELEKIINTFYEGNCGNKYIGWNYLFEADRNRLISQIKKACKKYVVGAFFGDTKEMMYSFSKKDEWVEFNPLMVEFIKENNKLLYDLNYNKWAKFYENKNDAAFANELSKKVDKSCVRKGENVYRSILAYEFEILAEEKNEMKIGRINTLELLFDAEASDVLVDDIDAVEVEEELYKDFSHMTEYLKDPILLINHLKKSKGIVNY